MKIIAGLGNPGPQYANTPHSVGFEVVEAIAHEAGASWEEKKAYKCRLARCKFAGADVMLVEPLTFMNLSGESVAPIVKYHNCTSTDLLVIHDDIDLPAGRIRVKKNGSCGGHNGVRNIIERLGTQNFTRLKLGVGKNKENVIGFVLGKFDPATRKTMDQVVAAAAQAAATILKDGPDCAMNTWNGWTPVEG